MTTIIPEHMLDELLKGSFDPIDSFSFEFVKRSFEPQYTLSIIAGDKELFKIPAWNFEATFEEKNIHKPDRIIFNDNTTVCIFPDGEKVVVDLLEGDTYERNIGVSHCIAKHVLGSWTNLEKLIEEKAEYYSNSKKNRE